MEQNKKTMRHFYCRDVLWDTFEQMANDFDCSIDYLINEAMRHYARSKNYGAEIPTAAPPRASGPTGVVARRPPPPPSAGGTAAGRHSGAQRVAEPTSRPRTGAVRPLSQSVRPGAAPAADHAGQSLVLMFDNQQIPIDKDQFVIGRGSKTSDLAIKDGNISRKHAAIVRRNGAYYIKDLGSTNGIDYQGMRIDNKRIDDGDIFHLCDYELKFVYR